MRRALLSSSGSESGWPAVWFSNAAPPAALRSVENLVPEHRFLRCAASPRRLPGPHRFLLQYFLTLYNTMVVFYYWGARRNARTFCLKKNAAQ